MLTRPSCGSAPAPTYFSSFTARAVTRFVAKRSVLAVTSLLSGSVSSTQSGAVPSGSWTRQENVLKTTTSEVEASPSATVRLTALTGAPDPVGRAVAFPVSFVVVLTSRGVFIT